MAHLINIDVFIEISDLKVKECFIGLVRFTVIMGRKFRDPSWCPLKIEGVRLIGVARNSYKTSKVVALCGKCISQRRATFLGQSLMSSRPMQCIKQTFFFAS